jgi:hypothetical protein
MSNIPLLHLQRRSAKYPSPTFTEKICQISLSYVYREDLPKIPLLHFQRRSVKYPSPTFTDKICQISLSYISREDLSNIPILRLQRRSAKYSSPTFPEKICQISLSYVYREDLPNIPLLHFQRRSVKYPYPTFTEKICQIFLSYISREDAKYPSPTFTAKDLSNIPPLLQYGTTSISADGSSLRVAVLAINGLPTDHSLVGVTNSLHIYLRESRDAVPLIRYICGVPCGWPIKVSSLKQVNVFSSYKDSLCSLGAVGEVEGGGGSSQGTLALAT